MNTPLLEDLRPRVLSQALQQISSKVEKTTECCIICLGDLSEQCEALPCRHKNFDFICLVTWLEQAATCPLCKTTVQEVRYELNKDGTQGKLYTVPGPLKESNQRNSDHSGHQIRGRLPYGAGAIPIRRFIYRHNLYSRHVGSNEQQPPEQRHKEFSPQDFNTDTELVNRTRRWLRRELGVFQFLAIRADSESADIPRASNVDYLLEYMIAILKHAGIRDSTGQAEDMVQEFLGRKHARLFLHELNSWLRSPYTHLSAWDSNVQYHGRNLFPGMSQDTGTEVQRTLNIPLKYSEPADARKPPLSQAWRLYVLKGDDVLEVIELWKRSVWLLGREERVVDLVTPHPSCSGQHAALQFRYVSEDKEEPREGELAHDGSMACVGLYLIDLNSTHGTIVNGERIESGTHTQVRHKDVFVCGGSKREYVFILPPS